MSEKKPVTQAGVKNFLGKQEMVKAPKFWLSEPGHVKAKLAYITNEEEQILIDKNLYGSLKGKANKGPAGLPSLQGGDFGAGGGNSGGGNGDNNNRENRRSSQYDKAPNPYSGGSGGVQTSGLAYGGSVPGGQSNKTESWNGTAWTEQDDLSSNRATLGGAGATASSSLAFGGYEPPGVISTVEEFTANLGNKTISAS